MFIRQDEEERKNPLRLFLFPFFFRHQIRSLPLQHFRRPVPLFHRNCQPRWSDIRSPTPLDTEQLFQRWFVRVWESILIVTLSYTAFGRLPHRFSYCKWMVLHLLQSTADPVAFIKQPPTVCPVISDSPQSWINNKNLQRLNVDVDAPVSLSPIRTHL